jgi:hypothetical protein
VPISLDRRAFLSAAGLAAGGLATLGLDRLLAARNAELDFGATARALVESLTPAQRRAVMLPWQHPSRGLVAHVACMGDAPRVADTLSVAQQELVHRVYQTMTSEAQRRRFGRLVGLEAGGLDPCAILLYGDPFERGGREFQLVLSGAHLLIRGGGISDGGSAFGGPLGYGHQLGNGVPRLPGSAFAYHGDAANAFLATLPAPARAQALVAGEPPHETAVQLQGGGGVFRGLPARSLGDPALSGLASLVDVVLSCYDEADREAAWGCIRRNGGVEALHFAVWSERGFYDDGSPWSQLQPTERERRGEPYWHVWRIEGPGAVLHFRGWPHVHASIHLADDGGVRQHVGEELARTPRLLEDAELRPLVVEALREAAGTLLAFHADAIPARFVPGPVTTSVVWNLDPFDAELSVMTIRGAAMSEPVRRAATAQGAIVEDGLSYRIALPSGFADDREIFGEPERVESTGLRTRGVYEQYFRRNGLARLA